MIAPDAFIRAVQPPPPESELALGTIDEGYTSGQPRVRMDGETRAGARPYPVLSGYVPEAGDRVLLARVGHGWVVLGGVGAPTPRSPLLPEDWDGHVLGTSYPVGVSLLVVQPTNGAGFPFQWGTVQTSKASNSRLFQLFHANNQERMWSRWWYIDAWGPWVEYEHV